ncbi:MAG: stage II sporulation protein D [Bacilli bacterium]
MKKILFITLFVIFIPFFIVSFFNVDKKEEIELTYMSNTIIRVKRLSTGDIEYLPFEEYIVGVLAGEMPIYFEKEALKAQAVAARSYALKRISYNKDNDYDVVDSILNQVYLDNSYLKEAWGDNYITNINKLREVVNETSLEYLDYNGEVIDALFFSTSNGYTEAASLVFNVDLPYLKSVKSDWDSKTSSAFKSTTSITLEEFYQKIGIEYADKLEVNVLKRSSTNRIISIEINGNVFSGRQLYEKLGLKSTDFSLVQDGKNVIINTVGYGHGVGMSQYGAEGMAEEGYSYVEILKYYYNGTSIKKMEN